MVSIMYGGWRKSYPRRAEERKGYQREKRKVATRDLTPLVSESKASLNHYGKTVNLSLTVNILQ